MTNDGVAEAPCADPDASRALGDSWRRGEAPADFAPARLSRADGECCRGEDGANPASAPDCSEDGYEVRREGDWKLAVDEPRWP